MNCHQTQGMGFIPTLGDFYYQFHLRKTLVPVSSHDTHIFAGFDPTLTGIADLANGATPLVKSVLSGSDPTGGLRSTLEVVKQRVGEAIGLYRPDDPLPSARPLLEGLSLLQDLEHRLCQPGIVPDPGSVAGQVPDDAMPVHLVSSIAAILGRKVKEFEEAIARCLGLRLQCLCTRRKLTPGESLWLSARLWNHRDVTIDKVHFHIGAPDNWDVIAEEGFKHHDAPENPVARYEAFFYAGVAAVGSGPVHRPHKLFHYMIHYPFAPSFVVDISTVWQRMVDVLATYESQFGPDGAGLETPICSRSFVRYIEARAIWFGAMIGAGYGEPFLLPGPVPLRERPGTDDTTPSGGDLPPFRMFR